MKLNCKVIEDLMPLYLDDICSEESREIIEEHVKECEKCRKLIGSTQTALLPDIEPETTDAATVVKKGFRKIRLRWWTSLLLVIALIPVAFLSWNQIREEGLHFTNLYEYHVAQAFMKQLHQGNYEKAHGYINLDSKKQNWIQGGFGEEKLKTFDEDSLEKFCEFAEEVEALGGIQEYEYIGISQISESNDGTSIYRIVFKILFNEKVYLCNVDAANGGVVSFLAPGSFRTDPFARFSSWMEFLWQDYEGCYLDFDLNQYVYY